MADEPDKKEEKAAADADAGQKLDKLLTGIDAMSKRMDAFHTRMDAMEDMTKADKARKDADDKKEEEEKKAAADKRKDDDARKDGDGPKEDEPAKEVAADKRKDSAKKDDADDDKRKDSAADSVTIAELREQIAALGAKMPKQVTDADYDAMASAQARADSVFSALGDRAPRPLDGETGIAYRRRLAGLLKKHSEEWKTVNLGVVAADEAAFAIAERQIYVAAQAAARHPIDIEPGILREVTEVNPATGQRMTKFYGHGTFIAGLKRNPNAVTRIGLRKDH